MAEFQLRVNGRTRVVEVASAVPPLYVSMNDLELPGPRFGRGLAQCGYCVNGIQMEEYPFTPERVLAALASA